VTANFQLINFFHHPSRELLAKNDIYSIYDKTLDFLKRLQC